MLKTRIQSNSHNHARALPRVVLTGILAFGMAAAFLLSGAVKPAQAQDIKPTPEQMRLFQQLPPSQRQELMDAYLKSQKGGRVRSEALDPQQQPELDLGGLSQDFGLPFLGDQLEEVVRIQGNDTVVIELAFKEALNSTERSDILSDPVLSQFVGSRSYILDHQGNLVLPGLVRIPLLGLDAEEAQKRVGAEPALQDFDVTVTILQLTRVGIHGLQPFGKELFQRVMDGFVPTMDVPVPPDYVLGPGDTIQVQLYGKQNAIYDFEVTRDGVLNLPELGPMNVAGLSFSEFREDLRRKVEQMLIGTQVSITMGDLRSIRVFVLGDVVNPGSYMVSSLATVTYALMHSGGVSDIGSMRNIQLKRQGKVVGRLDLYDLLLNGDNKNDARLSPGDVIFVPPAGSVVGVAGAVKRPAIYELRQETTVGEVLALAGGISADAYPAGARLERAGQASQMTILGLDLSRSESFSTRVNNGDAIDIPRVLASYRNAVTLAGQVQRPGVYPWRQGLRITDLLPSALDVQSGADLDYVLIRRESSLNLKVQALATNLLAAQQNPGGPEDLELQARDTIHVFALEYGRQRIIEPLLQELARQSTHGDDFSEVRVSGKVRAPGRYPMEADMRISDLIAAGGSLSEDAFALEAELTRHNIVDGERRETEIIQISLADILAGDPQADLLLKPYDFLSIKSISQWEGVWQVTIKGEVKFPGTYAIRRGESLNSVLKRAGGLTELAFPEGAVFLREDLKLREKEQIEVLARRLESDLASLSLQSIDSSGSEALTIGQSLLAQLRSAEPVGRLVVDLQSLSKSGQLDVARDIEMKHGDQLLIPRRSQEVTVLGEVQYATSHIYQPGLARSDYIAKSGGLTRKADKNLIYVVRASGAVVAGKSSKWFGGGDVEIRPGDSIVVPLDTDRIRPLTFWTNVTQILYQGALAVAAIKTFNN